MKKLQIGVIESYSDLRYFNVTEQAVALAIKLAAYKRQSQPVSTVQ